MQWTGYLKVNKRKFSVLVRQGNYKRYFKLRKSGKLGTYMDEESYYIETVHPELIEGLKQGETISL